MNAPCRTYALGEVYSVTFTLDGAALTAAWSPEIPDREAGRALLPAYLAAIEDFVAGLGGDALLVIGV